MTAFPIKPNPELDLVLERDIDVPVDLVWKAWTTPSHIRHWFVPKPWSITSCEIDLRPGARLKEKNFPMSAAFSRLFPTSG
jgi:uncharacterized protein YndB with AHSA1/START domain